MSHSFTLLSRRTGMVVVSCCFRALVNKLHEKQVPVYLISGGFRRMIEPIAMRLKIPMTNVFANELMFDAAGNVSLS